MDIEIIYEDAAIVAINKPSGIVLHKGVKTGYTLADWILEQFPYMQEVGEPHRDEEGNPISRPGIVHRLDKQTSGVVVLAKNQETFSTLKKHFQKGTIEKEYHAFVYGKPKKERGSITLPIGGHRSDIRKRSTRRDSRGKQREAKTEYVCVSQCKDNISFVKFFPHTGRTHQIRVHAQSLQIPIVADPLYAPSREPMLGFSRLALHAQRITLHTHTYENGLDIIAPYPPDFKNALTECALYST